MMQWGMQKRLKGFKMEKDKSMLEVNSMETIIMLILWLAIGLIWVKVIQIYIKFFQLWKESKRGGEN